MPNFNFIVLALASALLFAFAVAGLRKLRGLPLKHKKRIAKKLVRQLYKRLEDAGILPRSPAFVKDYHRLFPELELLERNHAVIRQECLALLEHKDDLTDMKAMGGQYTRSGVHTARWKMFTFKSGKFIDENCALAPQTAALLRRIPRFYNAFFSILDPGQTLPPHRGFYKGFLRYHLGVIVPKDNADERCWLEVSDHPADNPERGEMRTDHGERYYWHEGEGVVFDDTHAHTAANESDEVRVVLWLDLLRPLPWYLEIAHRVFIWIAARDESLKAIRRASVVETEAQALQRVGD